MLSPVFQRRERPVRILLRAGRENYNVVELTHLLEEGFSVGPHIQEPGVFDFFVVEEGLV